MNRMSHAAAFFVAIASGIGAGILLMLWSAWTLRKGAARRTSRQVFLMGASILVVPLALAVAMPDFKTALIAWFGFVIGYSLSRLITMPLAYVLARRIERNAP
jgi:cell division protein FtsW (lipid II flippase)